MAENKTTTKLSMLDTSHIQQKPDEVCVGRVIDKNI